MIENLIQNGLMTIVLKVAATVVITYIISMILDRLFKRLIIKDRLHLNFLRSIIKALILVIGIVIAISLIPGMSSLTTTILASSGVLAVVISLGAQESFSNIISGLIIVASKPFELGDRLIIRDSGVELIGTVEEITLRHTVIKTFKNTKYIITNSKLDSLIIENTTRSENMEGIVDFVDISVSYESNLDKAIEVLADVVGNHPLYWDIRTDEEKDQGKEKVVVRVRCFEDSGIAVRANVRTKCIDDSFIACSDCRRLVKKRFEEENIEIPYNKLVVLNNNEKEK